MKPLANRTVHNPLGTHAASDPAAATQAGVGGLDEARNVLFHAHESVLPRLAGKLAKSRAGDKEGACFDKKRIGEIETSLALGVVADIVRMSGDFVARASLASLRVGAVRSPRVTRAAWGVAAGGTVIWSRRVRGPGRARLGQDRRRDVCEHPIKAAGASVQTIEHVGDPALRLVNFNRIRTVASSACVGASGRCTRAGGGATACSDTGSRRLRVRGGAFVAAGGARDGWQRWVVVAATATVSRGRRSSTAASTVDAARGIRPTRTRAPGGRGGAGGGGAIPATAATGATTRRRRNSTSGGIAASAAAIARSTRHGHTGGVSVTRDMRGGGRSGERGSLLRDEDLPCVGRERAHSAHVSRDE